jgi:hypothetical protein
LKAEHLLQFITAHEQNYSAASILAFMKNAAEARLDRQTALLHDSAACFHLMLEDESRISKLTITKEDGKVETHEAHDLPAPKTALGRFVNRRLFLDPSGKADEELADLREIMKFFEWAHS